MSTLELKAEGASPCSILKPDRFTESVDSNVDQLAPLPDTDSVAAAVDTAMQGNGVRFNAPETLASLQPSERVRKRSSFHSLFPDIEAALARGVTHADIRAALKRVGLSLSAATFRRMLEDERKLNQAASNPPEPLAGGAP